MKLEMFAKEINLELFYQFKEMILSLSENDYDVDKINSSVLGFEKPKISLQEMYNLRYPGEVLERYKERGLDSMECRRALMLALTECIPAIQTRMFNNSQLDDFLNDIKECAGNDIFLVFSLMYWEDNLDSRLELCSKIAATQVVSDAGLLYVLNYVRDLPGGWDLLEERLSYIFLLHNIDIYENVDIITWLQREYALEILKSKRSCTRILKLFLKMQEHWISLDSKEVHYLKNLGYTEQEIIYISMYTSRCWEITKNTPHFRSIQKIMINGCKYFISARVIENNECINLCLNCLQSVTELLVCCEGAANLKDAIGKVKIGTIEMYNVLWNKLNENHKLKSWFYVDVLEPEWDDILAIIGPGNFRDIAEEAMFNNTENLHDYLSRYEEICKSEYKEDLLKEITYRSRQYITVLCDAGVLDIHKMIDECVNQEDANYVIKTYVKAYINDTSVNKMNCWRWIVNKYDLDTLSDLTSVDGFISGFVGLSNGTFMYDYGKKIVGYSDTDKMQLFKWTMEELYYRYTDKMIDTLISILTKSDISFIPDSDVQQLCTTLLESNVISDNARFSILKKYYPDDYERAVEEKETSDKIRRQKEKEQETQNWKDDILEKMSESEDPVTEFISACDDYKRYRDGYSQVCLSIFLEQKDQLVYTEENLCELCETLANILNSSKVENFTFEDYKKIINELGVTV